MRLVTAFMAAAVLASAFTACGTLQPENVPIYGAAWSVTRDDIHAAIAAARAGDPQNRTARIYNIKVHNRSEIYVSFGNDGLSEVGPEAQVKRINGKWRYIETWRKIVTS
jgi:hypothetical protein